MKLLTVGFEMPFVKNGIFMFNWVSYIHDCSFAMCSNAESNITISLKFPNYPQICSLILIHFSSLQIYCSSYTTKDKIYFSQITNFFNGTDYTFNVRYLKRIPLMYLIQWKYFFNFYFESQLCDIKNVTPINHQNIFVHFWWIKYSTWNDQRFNSNSYILCKEI